MHKFFAKPAIRNSLLITLLSIAAQATGFLSQVFIAKQFGASGELDAFLAANALPQYLIAILLGSFGSVLIPVIVEYRSKGMEKEANKLIYTVFNSIILVLGVFSILGILFSHSLLALNAPGLSPELLSRGSVMAKILWPMIIFSGLVYFFTSVYQAENRFVWQMVVPLIGGILNLFLIILLSKWLQGMGLAIAAASSVVIQAILLFRILKTFGKYKFFLSWKSEGMQQVLWLFLPLLLVSIFSKITPLIDRYLASSMSVGSISHLNYAFKLLTIASMLISTAISMIIFPRMAKEVSKNDWVELKRVIWKGLKIMWIFLAPVISIGAVICFPLVVVIFQRGLFSLNDSLVVSDLLRYYLISLIGICMGSISGKIFYVLRDTKTLAIVGSFEVLAYVMYTAYFSNIWGPVGVVVGFVIYNNLSFLWHMIYMKYKIGLKITSSISFFIFKICFAAALAAYASFSIMKLIPTGFEQLVAAIGCGFFVYAIIVLVIDYKGVQLLFE